MLFRTEPSGVLAISQPTHAWISGQILRAWGQALGEPLLLAAEQHDIGWLDWEAAPTFNPNTGRPHLFREIGASVHSPMWRRGIERAAAAWGAHVALLVSRHGGVIYRGYTDRHRIGEADAAAAQAYLEAQAPIEAAWSEILRLTEQPGHSFDFFLSPWPFRKDVLMVEGEARRLPATGRFADEAAMRTWLQSPERTVFHARLTGTS